MLAVLPQTLHFQFRNRASGWCNVFRVIYVKRWCIPRTPLEVSLRMISSSAKNKKKNKIFIYTSIWIRRNFNEIPSSWNRSRSGKRKSNFSGQLKRDRKNGARVAIQSRFQARSVVDSEKYTGVAAIFHPASLENLFRAAAIIATCCRAVIRYFWLKRSRTRERRLL